MRRSALVSCLTLVGLLPAVGISCKPANGESRDTVGRTVVASVPSQEPPADPCAILSRTDVEQVLGPLAEPGQRARSAERPDVDPDGNACVYTLAGQSPAGGSVNVAVQLVFGGASLPESGFGMVKELIAKEMGDLTDGSTHRAKPAVPNAVSAGEWDYEGGVPGLWVGRIGHVAVQIGARGTLLPIAKIEKLAAIARDRIPDLPIAAPLVDPNEVATGKDPCDLVSAADAEAMLGKLTVRPYRSQESTPFVDGSGSSCTYYRGRHRVLILTPTWTDARTQFRMAAGLGQGITSMLGVGEQSADTLDGPWDQATGSVDGRLYFLKGDRMLEMDYKSSGVDAATAVRVATAAVRKL